MWKHQQCFDLPALTVWDVVTYISKDNMLLNLLPLAQIVCWSRTTHRFLSNCFLWYTFLQHHKLEARKNHWNLTKQTKFTYWIESFQLGLAIMRLCWSKIYGYRDISFNTKHMALSWCFYPECLMVNWVHIFLGWLFLGELSNTRPWCGMKHNWLKEF